MSQIPASRKLVYLALTASAAFFWGAGFAVAKFALREVSPLELLAGACVFSAITQVIWTVVRGRVRLLGLPRPFVLPVVGLALAGQNVLNGLTYLGLAYTTATNAALLYGFSPVLIAVLASLLLGERFTAWKLAGAAAGFFGVVLIITQGQLNSLGLHGVLAGNLIVFGATVYWAAYSVITRWVTQRIPVETYSFYILTLGAVPLTAWVWLQKMRFPLSGTSPWYPAGLGFHGHRCGNPGDELSGIGDWPRLKLRALGCFPTSNPSSPALWP